MSTQDLPQRDLYRGITITTESTQLHSFSSTQEEGTNSSTKQRKKIQLSDPNDHKQLLVILKDHKQYSLTNKILEDRLAMKSSSMRVHKAFEKETTKKILGKNY